LSMSGWKAHYICQSLSRSTRQSPTTT
jgi:hypothetical protein